MSSDHGKVTLDEKLKRTIAQGWLGGTDFGHLTSWRDNALLALPQLETFADLFPKAPGNKCGNPAGQLRLQVIGRRLSRRNVSGCKH
jgi:hypothetical protein